MSLRNTGRGRRVVVTGIGAVTSLGHDVASTWQGLEAGRCGVRTISLFDASKFDTQIAAEVRDFPFDSLQACPEVKQVLDRKNSFGYAAAQQAMADAHLAPGSNLEPNRFGIALGTEGRRDTLLPELNQRKLEARTLEQRRAVLATIPDSEYLRYAPYGLAYALGGAFQARGPITTISTACTSSSQALGNALDKIRSGEADVMLAGGAESLMEPTMVSAFILLGALSHRNDDPQRACRPFDATRDGFILAEGAAMLVLEDAWHAYRRGARIYAELAGFGCSINAYRITDSPPDGQGPFLAMRAALDDAGMTPGDIDYINAHGTSTVQNDASETVAIKRCFGELAGRVPISSTKSMTGHMVNAAGAIEALIAALVIQNGYIPPTINYENPDPVCDLDYVPNQGRRVKVRAVISNSFGFGGSNGSLVLREYVA